VENPGFPAHLDQPEEEYMTGQTGRVRVMIADDHEIVRRGLRAVLGAAQACDVVGEASDGVAAVELALRTRPDVAVLDVSLPLMNGLEATRRIRQSAPKTEVLIFTMHESEGIVREVAQAGARGYVHKTDDHNHILAGVRALAQHRPYLSPRVSDVLAEHAFAGEPEAQRHATLTAREQQVVQLIAEGNSNKLVSRMLNLSVKTVETHRAAAMRKIGVSSTADLVRYAIRNHLVMA
jgi:DNA-binding NarL/FixJ family response regulator